MNNLHNFPEQIDHEAFVPTRRPSGQFEAVRAQDTAEAVSSEQYRLEKIHGRSVSKSEALASVIAMKMKDAITACTNRGEA